MPKNSCKKTTPRPEPHRAVCQLRNGRVRVPRRGTSGFGEMDIISGFEPEGVGSIPAGPAKIFLVVSQNIVDRQQQMLYNRDLVSYKTN